MRGWFGERAMPPDWVSKRNTSRRNQCRRFDGAVFLRLFPLFFSY
jgi:hypothetical protein